MPDSTITIPPAIESTRGKPNLKIRGIAGSEILTPCLSSTSSVRYPETTV